jgi:multidrug resistance efflux pump
MTADEDAQTREQQRELYKTTQPLFVIDANAAKQRAERDDALDRLVTGGRGPALTAHDVIRSTISRVGEEARAERQFDRVDYRAPHAEGERAPADTMRPTRTIASETAQALASELMRSAVAAFEQVIARRSDQERAAKEAARPDLLAAIVTPLDETSEAPKQEAAEREAPEPEAPKQEAAQQEAPDPSPAAPQRSERAAAPTQSMPVPAAAPEPFRASPRLSARAPLFRAEAIAAYARGERAASVLRITTIPRWALLAALGLAVLVALAVISFAKVEERSAARGVLRTPFGLSPVLPLISGRVRDVLVAPGAHVEAGQLLVLLDTTPIEAERAEAAQRLAALEEQWRLQSESLRAQFSRSEQLGKARVALLESRQVGQRRRVARSNDQVRRMKAPELDAVIERSARDQSEESLDRARDELLRMADELSALRLQLGSSRSEFEQQLAAGQARIREAEAKFQATGMLLQQAELRAPNAGKIESLRVHPGQTVQAGEWIARIVRDGTPHTIVAFVPERDAAFLHVDAAARVEIDKLPAGEFGLAKARVARVGGELAEASEIVQSLGEGALTGPHVRVELELQDAPETERVKQFMRAGTLVTARIALRDRRLLAIVFEPVRRWLE